MAFLYKYDIIVIMIESRTATTEILIPHTTLDGLVAPELTLRAPVYKDGILVNGDLYDKDDETITTRLVIVTEPKQEITIARQDNEPLQIYDADLVQTGERSALFARPIGRLSLFRAHDYWEAELSEGAMRASTLRFIDLVADLAVSKQARLAHQQYKTTNTLVYSSSTRHSTF